MVGWRTWRNAVWRLKGWFPSHRIALLGQTQTTACVLAREAKARANESGSSPIRVVSGMAWRHPQFLQQICMTLC